MKSFLQSVFNNKEVFDYILYTQMFSGKTKLHEDQAFQKASGMTKIGDTPIYDHNH